MDFDDWVEKYKPVALDVREHQGEMEIDEGRKVTLFSPYNSKDWAFLLSQPDDQVWSLIETGKAVHFELGLHGGKSTGYLVAGVPYDPSDPHRVDYLSADLVYSDYLCDISNRLRELVLQGDMSEDMAQIIEQAFHSKKWPSAGSIDMSSVDVYCSFDENSDSGQGLGSRLCDVSELDILPSEFMFCLSQTLQNGELVFSAPQAAPSSTRTPGF